MCMCNLHVDWLAHFPTPSLTSLTSLSLSFLFFLALFSLCLFPPPFPVTKGVFLFKGPQKTLGTKSRNCYNWQRRGEAFGTKNSHIPIMLTEIWACTISECRQTWQGNYSLLMNSHNMLSAALR